MEQKKEYRDTEQNNLRGEPIKCSILKHRVFFQGLYHNIISVITGDKPGFRQYSGFNSRPKYETEISYITFATFKQLLEFQVH
jgi:hypothetical protein